jgi:hypothetical protein
MKTGLRSLDCISFGVPFRLAADSDALLAKMLDVAPWGTQPCAPSSGKAQSFAVVGARRATGYRLLAGGKVVAEGLELQPALDRLAAGLMVHVANHAPDRVFIHAGVVGWRGHALVLPGASFAGKTTLVAELVRAGATYYSDEYAVLDEHGQVHPYARALQLRQQGSPVQTSVAISRLNGAAGTTPLPVSRVVFTQYVASGHWAPRPLSPGMAALEMLRHAIPVQRTPARVMATLAKMMETATALRSSRGEAGEAAGALLLAMGERRLSAC